jgi:hypothetical protein
MIFLDSNQYSNKTNFVFWVLIRDCSWHLKKLTGRHRIQYSRALQRTHNRPPPGNQTTRGCTRASSQQRPWSLSCPRYGCTQRGIVKMIELHMVVLCRNTSQSSVSDCCTVDCTVYGVYHPQWSSSSRCGSMATLLACRCLCSKI